MVAGEVGRCVHDLAAEAAPVIDQAIVGDAEQPGRKLRRHLVMPARANDPHPDVLVDLVGDRRRASLVQQIAIEPAAPPLVQQVERGRVAVAIGEHQRFIAARIGRFLHQTSGRGQRGYPGADDARIPPACASPCHGGQDATE